MRIFQVLESSANERIATNRTWYRNLYEPLIDLGHDVVLVDAGMGAQAMRRNDAALRATFSQQLLDRFRNEHTRQPFDLVFTYLMDGMVDVGAIDEIRRAGVPTCNFSCNNIHQFDLVDELSPHFDFNLHAERDAAPKFASIGANALWWQMASNPKYFKPYATPRTIQASFVGANYALRARYIAHLLEHNIDVHAYGPRWVGGARSQWRAVAKHYQLLLRAVLARTPDTQYQTSANLADHDFRHALSTRFPENVHEPISDEELIHLYSSSHISLGFLEVYAHHDASRPVLQHLHLREFEAPMSGALYCTGFTDELAEFFEPDKEVIVYHNQHELLEKVRYYLDHPDAARVVREAGHQRALREHTYHHRYKTLFDELQLGSRS